MAGGLCKIRLCRPRKYSEGWEGANKQIYISNETFLKWRRLGEERTLPSDDSMACYLLNNHVNIFTILHGKISLAH